MIYGNKIGGDPSEKIYKIIDETGSISFTAIVVGEDNSVVFDAQAKDVAAGKTFFGVGGVSVGTNDVPLCRDIRGIREVWPGVGAILKLEKNDMWDYTYLQGFISTKNDPYNSIMLIADNAVYQDGIKVSDITKNDAEKAIYFNIKNNSDEVYLINYFICKEEEQ